MVPFVHYAGKGAGALNQTLRNPWIYALFLLPTLVLYALFMLYPVVQSFYYGFTRWDGVSPAHYIGLDNFKDLFKDAQFWQSFRNNLWFILFSCFVQVPLIIVFSLLISNVKRFKAFYKTAVFVPSILSTAVIGILWGFVYEPEIGLLNKFIGLFHGPQIFWLSDQRWAMLSILITNAWQWIGFYIILVLAAILAIPNELNEAAEIDGATSIQKAIHITVPLIKGIIIVVITLSIAGAMKAADIVLVMTRGGPFGKTEVMATYMINRSFKIFQYGYGSAIAVLIFLFTVLITLLFRVIARRWEED